MTAFTITHVIISLLGIGSGLVVIYGFLTAKRLDSWSAFFLATTILTSVTGFFFSFERFTPGHAIGILSLLALGLAVVARYPMRMAGGWRPTYVVSALISQYFNFAVLIIQSFLKVPALKDLAPTLTEPITQLVVLMLFVIIAAASIARFRPVDSEPATLTKSSVFS